MSSEDRRAPGATRTPFEGLVEVGGALGPSFEAQAVNVSEDGMQLRTAYLPDVGQPLACQFDAGPGQSVFASGEVVWAHPAERGGEFGVKFTDLDGQSVEALKRACGVEPSAPLYAGSKVRLHIEGLASPMRAKIKEAASAAVTVGSELGFLRVGKTLQLEDAENGAKRPACIDRVDLAVDPASNVPQLVVTLRYSDATAPPSPPREDQAPAVASPAKPADDLKAAQEASANMKGALAKKIGRIGPHLESLAQRARATVALLARKRGDGAGARRMTAPPPGGGLHTAGRRVVRGDGPKVSEEPVPPAAHPLTKRKAAVGAAVMIAALLGAVAIKRSHRDSAIPRATAATTALAEPSAQAALSAAVSPSAPAPVPAPEPSVPSLPAPNPLADTSMDLPPHVAHRHHPHPAPFGNGPVHHGNVLRLKMDGPVEAIEGAQQPTGFTVKLPGRKSLEAAAPLASRDERIASIRVTNEQAGAELMVVFKDGVPNYQVSGRGDALVIAIAPAGTVEKTVAKKDEKGGKSPKHGKRHAHEDGGV